MWSAEVVIAVVTVGLMFGLACGWVYDRLLSRPVDRLLAGDDEAETAEVIHGDWQWPS